MRPLFVLAIALSAAPAWSAPSVAAQGAKAAAVSKTQPAAPSSPVPPATPAQAPAAQAPEAGQPAPSQPESTPYTYNADGRRDPFQSLTAGGDSKAAPRPTAAGIAGIRIDELSVRGIMQSRERLVAMVQGADNRTYLIHQGDKLADGVVKSITPQGLVLVQDVSEPRAKDKSREVRKLLRSADDDKE